MRASGCIRQSLPRALESIVLKNDCRITSVRHGSQRTIKTPHWDPQDYARDRRRAPASLYQRPEEWVDEPVYPAIEPVRNTREWVRFTRLNEAKQLEALPLKKKMDFFTFAPPWERMYEGTRHRDFRRRFWKPYEVPGYSGLYNITPFYQYITKTAIVSDQLPTEYYSYLDDAVLADLVEKVREPVSRALLSERHFFKKNLELVPPDDRDGTVQTQNAVDAITRIVDLTVGKSYPHLSQLQRDLETKCRAYWRRSGFTHGEGKSDHLDPFNNEPHQPIIWHTCEPVSTEMQLQYVEDDDIFRMFRHEQPLPPVVPRSSPLVTAKGDAIDLTEESHSPKVRGLEAKQYLPHWIPGFWFGDPNEYSTLSIAVPRKWSATAGRLGEDAALENLNANAVMGGFGRILAQAMFLGFTFLNELTYPIVTQSIFTTGRDWVFSTYQANTIALWQRDEDNPYRNLAWITPPMRLFEKIEADKVVGLNDEVLKNIIRQYLKAPMAPDAAVNLRPYVGEPVRSYWKTELSRLPFTTSRIENENMKQKWTRLPDKPEI